VKGLIGKILKNNSNSAADNAENEDNSHTRFECKDYENVKERIEALDVQLACDGYKTIGLGIRRSPDAEVEFAGIVPMLDPPRDDAPLCIQMIREAGVNVKMVTGDHQNIAKTTAGIIGLGTNILPNTAFSECSGAKLNQLVLEADGFAQVMPNDKETVVLEEQAAGWIVGFCGDGMNDALALNAAQVGIAVADAMDAAIKASAIQLLDPGLQCIYTAIVESRKIFRRVKAYVTYRFAATIQVIVFLSVAVFVSGCQIDLIYIVILALLNDLTMMPLSSDNQKASIVPDNPVVWKILAQASTFGLLQAAISIAWFYIANQSDFLDTVKDSHHVEPITWFSYLQSQGGTDGTMAKQYRQCVAQLCPALSCHHKDTGALSVAECSCKDGGVNGWGGLQPHATEDQPCCSNLDAFLRMSVDGNTIVCPSMGKYSHPQLPEWQECCVEYAGLKHPGQPHYGSTDSVCTEISTVSVFVQILIASEFMIFPVRALSWMWTNRASTALYVSVFLTCFIFSIFAALGVPRDFGPLGDVFSQTLGWRNMGLAWAWSCGATLIIDIVKYNWVLNVDGTTEEIVHERVADRFNTEKAIALDVSRQSTTSTSIRRTEASIQSQRGDSTVTGSTGMRPSTRFSVGNAVVPGRTDPASLGAALARASRQSRLSRRTGGQF